MGLKKIASYAICVVAFSAGGVLYDNYRRSTESDRFATDLAKALHEANKDTPRMIDESTRLEYVTLENRSTVAMRYTLPGIMLGDINSQEMLRQIKPAATKQVCSQETSRQFLRSGGSYGYEYADEVGRRIIKFQVRELDCT